MSSQNHADTKVSELSGLLADAKADAKKLINRIYQPTGYLLPNVSKDEMWEYAKERALEFCRTMLQEHSCYTLNDERWAVWAQIEIEVKNC